MLDAFIIEEIKRRERDQARDDRPAIQLPLPTPPPARRDDDGDRPEPPGGSVVIIDYSA